MRHLLRHDRYFIPQFILQRKNKGERRVSRQKIAWLRNIREQYGEISASSFRSVVNKVRVELMITNYT